MAHSKYLREQIFRQIREAKGGLTGQQLVRKLKAPEPLVRRALAIAVAVGELRECVQRRGPRDGRGEIPRVYTIASGLFAQRGER